MAERPTPTTGGEQSDGSGDDGGPIGRLTSRVGSHVAWIDRSLVGLCLASTLVVVLAGFVQVRYGSYDMRIGEVFWAVLDPNVLLDPRWMLNFLVGEDLMRAITGFEGELPELPPETLIVWTIRLPRVFVAVLVGMNLALSGAIFQAVTRNELASPYILGVSSGAGLAILLTLVMYAGLAAYLPIIAAAGGALAFLIVYAIAWQHGTSPVRLVLAGVIVGTVFQSLQTALFFFADDIGVVQTAIQWTTGSLTGVEWEEARIVLPWSIVVVALALAGARQLNVLQLGERTASSLGMNVERMRFGLSGIAVLAASASIAVAGIVSFVGLIVPHVVRSVVGSDYKKIVVGCLFVGPALMVAADVGARLFFPVVMDVQKQMPVGIVTGLIGGPYFLYMMRRKNLGEI
ncbi:FecCD family ABC transporter permease [Salinarchaeum laminariae]|uniref:FecCD family ABC transporter permease n=1 Tax=Salinarchaeum laminariae TaxID=869888 RepID=UPI0020BDFA97|nr:iron ABC transporter permease [Salinarchaeum laminariae]